MSTAFFGVIAHAAQPSVVTAPATEISETSATLHAIYHSGNTQGVLIDPPSVYFIYGTSISELYQGTQPFPKPLINHRHVHTIENLVPGQSYFYRAVMNYQGTTSMGDIMRFTTLAPAPAPVPVTNTPAPVNPPANTPTTPSSGTGTTNTNTNTPAPVTNIVNESITGQTADPAPVATNTAPAQTTSTVSTAPARNTASAATTATTATTAISGNGGVTLSITNNTDTLRVGEVVEYVVTVRNTGSTAITNTILFVDMPAELIIDRVSGNNANVQNNSITVNLGTIARNDSEVIRVVTRVNQAPRGNNQIIARAQVVSNRSTVQSTNSAFDTDTLTTQQGFLGLTASAGTAGTSPFGFLGWFMIGLFAILIVVGVRYYRKKEKEPYQGEYYQDADGRIRMNA